MIIKITSLGAYEASKSFLNFIMMMDAMNKDCKTLKDLKDKTYDMFEQYNKLALKDEEMLLSKKQIKNLKEDKKFYEERYRQ